MASVLVHIAAQGARCTAASAAALSVGRRVASELGATLLASAALPEAAPADALVGSLSRLGADRIEILPDGDGGPPRWSRTGPALIELCRRTGPRLVLLSADEMGDLAGRLAASLGAGYFADTLPCGERREPMLERFVEGRRAALRLKLSGLRAPLVATVAGAALEPSSGRDDDPLADDISVRYADARHAADGIEWLGAAPAAPLDRAAVVVSLGAGAEPREVALAADLARCLGGALGGTESACRRGLIPRDHAVGLGAPRISPRLYVSCAASGSRRHLAGIDPATTIVALNRDPDAPIFRAARYGLVGELAAVIPAFLTSLARDARR